MPHELNLISVVTVTKNDAVRLEKTLKSIKGQQDQSFEWVVVDGNSNDRTSVLLNSIPKNTQINHVLLEPKGIYNAMNYGAKGSTGKYILLLNAGDTFLSPNSVREINNLLSNMPSNVHAVASTVPHLTNNFQLFDLSIPWIELRGNYQIAHLNHQGVIMSRDVFFKLGGFDEGLKYASDGKLLDQFAALHKYLITEQMFVGFEIGGTAGRNYRATVAETEIFRPRSRSYLNSSLYILKNECKLMLIDLTRYSIFNYCFNLYVGFIRSARFRTTLSKLLCSPNPDIWSR